jgi:hypothetical protein
VVPEEEEEEEAQGSPQSFISDTYHPNRQYIYLYENIEPWDSTDTWIVDDLDVVSFLRDFRNSSIQLAQTQGNVSDHRVLYAND